MKLFKLIALLITCVFLHSNCFSQNILMNILTHNSGVVRKSETVLVEVTICNTSASDSVPMYKLKPQVSVPSEIARIATSGHTLPAGWTIISNDGFTIRFSNGTDELRAAECRTIFIAVKGKKRGGPSTISGSLLFSNGIAPGSAPGAPTQNDNPADNNSTSTCRIID